MKRDKVIVSSIAVMLAFAAFVCVPGAALAATINVPADYASIQAAITAAASGDTVVVADGTYAESINFSGKAITVKSANGAASCSITGAGGRVVTFNSFEGSGSVLDGFTVQNIGSGDGGISCSGASPIIKNCIVRSCSGSFVPGMGVNLTSSSAQLINCIVANNYVSAASPTPRGGGIFANGGSPTITNCTIVNNFACQGNGGGIYCTGSAFVTVNNSILWANRHGWLTGSLNQVYVGSGSVTLNYCDVDSGLNGSVVQNSCTSQTPLFVSAGSASAGGYGDYHLLGTSPCIDTGSDSYVTVSEDLDGNARVTGGAVDLGPYELVDVQAPVVTVTTPASPATSPVTIDYNITDAQGNSSDVTIEYSTDGGTNWNMATPASGDSNPQTSVPPGDHTFMWNAAADLPDQTVDVKVRVTAEDTDGYTGKDTTDLFTVDNQIALQTPENFTGVGVADNQIEWSWTDSPGAAAYTLEDTSSNTIAVVAPGQEQYVETTVSGENTPTTRQLRSSKTSLIEITVEPAGTVSGANLPWSAGGYHGQFLYTAAELSNTEGSIKKIYWQKLISGPGATYTDVSVTLGHSTRTSLEADCASNFDVDGSQLVRDVATYEAPVTSTGREWVEIPLDRSFYYDGTNNLVIDINTALGTDSISWSKVDSPGVYASLYGTAGGSSGAPWEKKFFLKLQVETISSISDPTTASAYTLVHDAMTDDFDLAQGGAAVEVAVTVTPPNNANVGLTGVRVERATNDTFTQDATTLQDFSDTYDYTDTGVSTGTTYWYRVTFRNADGVASAQSTGKSISVVGPDSPPVLDITAPAGGSRADDVQITYDISDYDSDPAQIVVEFSTDGGSTWSTTTMGAGGDGTSPLATSPDGTAHTYVWDTVTDDVGSSAPETVQLRIVPSDNDGTGTGDVTTFTVSNTQQLPPTVTITDPTTGTHGGDITITYTLTDPNADDCDLIVEYSTDSGGSWNPCTPGAGGDGVSALTSSPSGTTHTFVWASETDLPGVSASVMLRIIADDGNTGTGGGIGSDTTTFTVDNSAGVTAYFTGSPVTGDVPVTVQFNDQSIGNITSWEWDFGDGATSTDRNPSHQYSTAGTYDVSLTVTGPGSSDTVTKSGYVDVTGSATPPPAPKKKKSGCSCAMDRTPAPLTDMLGYFLPALLILCTYLAAVKRRRGAA